ncbi:MAG: ABC transporter permease, partial [Planctomycetota bacterium]
MKTLWQDVKYGFRMLLRNPGFSFAVLVLVAVGIGVNTTVFTVLNAYLLRPLPYERSDKIVMVQGRDREGQVYGVSYSDYRDWQKQATSFEELGCYSLRDQPVTVTAAYPPDRRSVAYVSGNFFPMFPARPAVGRLLSEEDDRAAAAPAVVIGHALWQHHFGGAPSAVGRSILLNGVSHAIVGVTRPTFQFPPYGGWARTDLWVAAGPAMGATGRGSPGSCFVVGRLRKGVDIRQAQAEMEAISARLPAEDPSRTVPSATVMRLHDWMTAGNWQLFFVVMGTVLMVFLVTCAN